MAGGLTSPPSLSARHPEITFDAARGRVSRLGGQFVDAYTADEWAVALGVHPSEIWGNWHTAADLEDGDLVLVGSGG